MATRHDLVATEDDTATRRVLDLMERQVQSDLNELDLRLASLAEAPGLDVFPLSDAMLEKTAALSFQKLNLQPFDQAVLAAVLTRADSLRSHDPTELAFCELDSDLQPWDKEGKRKDTLASLYDAAGVWVYGDFLMKSHDRPEDWPTGRSEFGEV